MQKIIMLVWMISSAVLEVLSNERKVVVEKFPLNGYADLICNNTNLENYPISWRRGSDVIPEVEENEALFSKVKFQAYKSLNERDEPEYVLVIKNVQYEDAGNYSCIIESKPPREFIHTVEVGDPKMLTTGQNFTADVGGKIVLPCEVKDLEGYWKIYWTQTDHYFSGPTHLVYKGDKLVTHDPNIKLVNGYNIEIQNVLPEHSGIWRCQILRANNQFALHRLYIQEVLSNEKMVVVKKFPLNGYADLICNNTNLENYPISWRRGSDVIPEVGENEAYYSEAKFQAYQSLNDRDEPEYVLVIKNVQYEDAGNYSCIIESKPPRELIHTVEVGDPKMLTTGQNFTADVGGKIVLPCEVKDLEGYWKVYWTKTQHDFSGPSRLVYEEDKLVTQDPNIKLVNGYNIEIQNVLPEHSGIWRCQIFKANQQFALHRLYI